MEPEVFMRHTSLMRTSVSKYHRHRFPAQIISHSVWLYFRFALSWRDDEEMLAMRGVILSYETVREWGLKFGQTYANGLRHESPRPATRLRDRITVIRCDIAPLATPMQSSSVLHS
jgi:transposase-like protein